MAQDTALLRYLLKGARRAPGSGSQRDLTFAFDGTNDYISSNATIGRTGYNMNVSGNVTTGSDGDGDYIFCNGNRSSATSTGTVANIGPVTTPAYTQATDFSFSFKFNSANLPAAGYAGIFGSGDDFAACLYSSNNIRITSKPTYSSFLIPYTPGTTVTIHVVYQASTGKAFGYKDGILQNSGGTTMSTTFTTNYWCLGDLGNETLGTVTSVPTKVYHACIRNKALTQAEVDADIALGNATKQDPSIVAYYIPENLQYNTQYLANPKDLSNATRTKGSGTTVTANTTVAPDGTTTADTVVWTGTSTTVSKCEHGFSTISGSTIASKTFVIKAFVKVVSGMASFRLKCTHSGVADYFSSNQVATTTRQEFTFTQTFTSSTSGTGIIGGLVTDTTNTAGSFEVRNVRLFLVNETLRDESPNIGGFIGWKHQKVLSFWIKPNIDSVNTADSQSAMRPPRFYCHMSQTTNQLNARYDNRLGSKVSIYNLGTGFRSKVHVSCVYYWTGSVRGTKIYINGFVQDSDTFTVDPPTSSYNTVLWSGRSGTTYFSGNIRDTRIYTFTGSFTDADALAIYNGGEPISPGITKYLHYKPPVGEVGTTTQDLSPNDRDGTLNGGVTRNYI